MRPGPVTELGWGPVDIIDDRDPLLVVWLISTIGFVAAADGVAQDRQDAPGVTGARVLRALRSPCDGPRG